MARDKLGDFEQHVLLVIYQLRGKGYAVSISDEIKQRSGRAVSLGAIYATVDRLEKKGLVSSTLGDPTRERGGKPKRFYQVSAPGLLALSNAREADRRFWADVPPLGSPA